MKKISLILMILVIASSTVSGQLTVYEPLSIKLTNYANAVNVPNEFLLFLPDKYIQIIFNPARAYEYDKKFIYGNIAKVDKKYHLQRFPQYGSGVNVDFEPVPSLSIATLLGAKTKWLFQIENGISNRKDEQRRDANYFSLYGMDILTGSEFEDSNIETRSSITNVKISRIKEMNSVAYSVGLFSIFDHGINLIDSEILRFDHRVVDHGDYTRNTLSSNDLYVNDKINYSRFAMGLEFSIAGRSWDFISTFSFQNGNNNSNIYNSSIRGQYDTTFVSYPDIDTTSSMNFDLETTTEFDITQSPKLFNFKFYFRKNLGILHKNDQFFVSLNSTSTTNNKINYNFHHYYEDLYLLMGNGLVGIKPSELSENLTTEGDNWSFRLSTGYALYHKADNLYIFTGFNPSIQYSKSKYLSPLELATLTYPGYYYRPPFRWTNQDYMVTVENVGTIYDITLPFYCNYKPYSWIALFGGINYSYKYSLSKSTSNNKTLNYINDSVTQFADIETTIESSLINSYQDFYLGISLYHHSGFVAHIAFNNNLDNYQNWNISIGYHY